MLTKIRKFPHVAGLNLNDNKSTIIQIGKK